MSVSQASSSTSNRPWNTLDNAFGSCSRDCANSPPISIMDNNTAAASANTAIAAREYGIPAVVGVRGATRLIRDGASITVDGNAGTVDLDASP